MASAIRSFMLPVGFSLSSFSRMRAPFSGTMWRRATSEVLPMQCRMSRRSSRMLLFYFGSLAPSTSSRSITGGVARRVGACAMSALAMGPLR